MTTTHRKLLGAPLAAALLALFAPSCTTDVYDKGDGAYSLMLAELADVYVDADLYARSIVTDDGELLAVGTPVKGSWMKTADSTYRAVAYFVRTAEGVAELKGLNPVGVAVPRKIKEMKTDPVRFESMWVGSTGRYLNACIYLLLGTTDDEKAVQMLGCRADTIVAHADGTTTQRLTLYHDQGGVPEYYSQRTYVSIPLGAIKADSVMLTIATYGAGTVSKTFSCPLSRQGRSDVQKAGDGL